MQHNRQTDTFRYGRAKWRIRQDDSFASTSSFFQWWQTIRATNISVTMQAAALRATNTYRDNDTSAQPQSERITIQGSRKSIAFVGKESNRLISDAFAERQNEPKGELWTPSQAMGQLGRMTERWNSYGVLLQSTVCNCFKGLNSLSCTRLSGRVRLRFNIRN